MRAAEGTTLPGEGEYYVSLHVFEQRIIHACIWGRPEAACCLTCELKQSTSLLQYYKNFAGFKGKTDGFLTRIQGLLAALPVSATGPPPPERPEPAAALPLAPLTLAARGSPAAFLPLQGVGAPPPEALQEADEALDWASGVLDTVLEGVDDAVGDVRDALAGKKPTLRNKKRYLSKAAAAAAGNGAQAAAAGAGPSASVAGAAAAVGSGQQQEPRGKGGFVSYMDSRLSHRPQEAFEGGVDNSNTPFVHLLDHLGPAGVDVEAARADAAAARAAGAAAPHPLAGRLAGLRYAAWQTEVTAPQLYRSFEETPFTYVDTLPALQAAGACELLCADLIKESACGGQRGTRPALRMRSWPTGRLQLKGLPAERLSLLLTLSCCPSATPRSPSPPPQ